MTLILPQRGRLQQAAAGGSSPLTVSWPSGGASGRYVSFMSGMTTGNSLVIATRIKRISDPGAGDFIYIFGVASNTALRIYNDNDVISARVELTNGVPLVIGTETLALNETKSIFLRCHLINSTEADYEIYVDGVLSGSDYSDTVVINPASGDIKQVTAMNTSGGGNSSHGFEMIGGCWVGNSGGDTLTYSDFFDGSDQPTFDSATVAGHTAVFFQNGDASTWDADGQLTWVGTGSLSDV